MPNPSTTTPGPADVARAWFERVWNQGDESAIDELFSPTGQAHGLPSPDGKTMTGPAGFHPFVRSFREAIPDIRIVVLRTVVEGSMCVAHCEVTGTHSGQGLGFAPTGKKVSFSGMSIVRVEDGQIQEGWNSFDFLTFYQHLGRVPQAL